MPDTPLICPHCSTRLRVRDRIYMGREMPCPECRQPLLVLETPDGLAVTNGQSSRVPRRRPKPVANGNASLSPGSTDAASGQPPVRPRVRTANRAPLVAWSAAGLLVAVGAAVLFWPEPRPQTIGPFVGATGEAGVAAVEQPEPSTNGFPQPDGSPAERPQPPDAIEVQLSARGRDLAAAASKDDAFPIGTFSTADQPLGPDERFSWIAVLEAANPPPGVRWDVRWDRPWRDAHHDAFVRRRVSRWQNPLVPKLAGDDGYPASHFVGVAGVGDDAPRLSSGHPRAGVFGDERQTRLDDIEDGTSETLLLAGVSARLGSWAAGGTASVRPFTREPVVNGPDGFGTGQAGSMFVLMADGSVRTISANIDSGVFERLATINDNARSPDKPEALLAGAERGEPRATGAERSEPPADETSKPGQPVGPAPATLPPPETTPQPPSKPVDIDVSLRQPLLRFEQTQPVPLSQMLKQLEALVGVPIRVDDEARQQVEPKLATPVKIKLPRTTVGNVVRDVLHQAGLAYRAEPDRLVVMPE